MESLFYITDIVMGQKWPELKIVITFLICFFFIRTIKMFILKFEFSGQPWIFVTYSDTFFLNFKP